MTKIQEMLINAYTTLILAERKIIDEVPADIKSEIEIKVAEKTIEMLG